MTAIKTEDIFDLVSPSKASRRTAGGINYLTLLGIKTTVSGRPIRGIVEE